MTSDMAGDDQGNDRCHHCRGQSREQTARCFDRSGRRVADPQFGCDGLGNDSTQLEKSTRPDISPIAERSRGNENRVAQRKGAKLHGQVNAHMRRLQMMQAECNRRPSVCSAADAERGNPTVAKCPRTIFEQPWFRMSGRVLGKCSIPGPVLRIRQLVEKNCMHGTPLALKDAVTRLRFPSHKIGA